MTQVPKDPIYSIIVCASFNSNSTHSMGCQTLTLPQKSFWAEYIMPFEWYLTGCVLLGCMARLSVSLKRAKKEWTMMDYSSIAVDYLVNAQKK